MSMLLASKQLAADLAEACEPLAGVSEWYVIAGNFFLHPKGHQFLGNREARDEDWIISNRQMREIESQMYEASDRSMELFPGLFEGMTEREALHAQTDILISWAAAWVRAERGAGSELERLMDSCFGGGDEEVVAWAMAEIERAALDGSIEARGEQAWRKSL